MFVNTKEIISFEKLPDACFNLHLLGKNKSVIITQKEEKKDEQHTARRYILRRP